MTFSFWTHRLTELDSLNLKSKHMTWNDVDVSTIITIVLYIIFIFGDSMYWTQHVQDLRRNVEYINLFRMDLLDRSTIGYIIMNSICIFSDFRSMIPWMFRKWESSDEFVFSFDLKYTQFEK